MPFIKTLSQSDSKQLVEHFLRLGSNDRRLRFGSVVSNTHVERYVDNIKWDEGKVFAIYDQDANIVAVAHVQKFSTGAEFGVSVEEHTRGKGYGSALFERAVNWAIVNKLDFLYTYCLSENAWMMKKARKENMSLMMSGTDAEAKLKIFEKPTWSHYIKEFEEDTWGTFDYMGKWQSAQWSAFMDIIGKGFTPYL